MTALMRRIDAERGDVPVVERQHQAAETDDLAQVRVGHEVRTRLVQRELALEELQRPGLRVHLLFDGEDGTQVTLAHRAHHNLAAGHDVATGLRSDRMSALISASLLRR